MARLLVDANGAALLPLVVLGRDVLGVGRAPDAAEKLPLVRGHIVLNRGRNLLKAVAVVGGNDNKSILTDTKLLQLSNRGTNSVVELEKVT